LCHVSLPFGITIGFQAEKNVMKKLLFIAIIALASTSFVTAQTVSVGGKTGASLTKISGQAFKEGFDLGYHVGFFAEVQGKKWGIQPEVMWNQVNTKPASSFNEVTNNWQQNTQDIQLNYLTIPILVRYKVADALTLNLGPQYGILLNKDQSLWNNGKEAFKSGDFSMVGGISVNISNLRVYGRYVVGLTDIKDVSATDNWKSQQIQLGIGYKIL
jgi:hypothetical protein